MNTLILTVVSILGTLVGLWLLIFKILEDVLIGTPSAQPGDNDIKEILEQLTKKQVAKEQITTYEIQCK